MGRIRATKTVAVAMIGLLLVLLPQLSQGEDTHDKASALIDLGNGEYYWADLEIGTNNTALNLLERATELHGLSMEVKWFPFGAQIVNVGDAECPPTGFWQFLYWDVDSEEWAMAATGPSIFELKNGDVVSVYCDPDFMDMSSPVPVPTPDHRYPSIMFRNSLANTGSAAGSAPSKGRVKWDYDTQKVEIDSTPAVGRGKVYVVGTNGLYVLDQETGELLWQNSDIKGQSSPTLYNNKMIVGAANGKVYCLDAETGEVLWEQMVQPNPVRQSITSSPKVWNKTVFIGTFNESGGNASVKALHLDNGALAWEYETDSIYTSSPAVVGGVVYIGIAGRAVDFGLSFSPPYGLISLLASNGTLLWRYETDGPVMSSPVVHENKLYFTSRDGYLHSLTTDGEISWKRKIGNSTSSPALSHGMLYVGTGLLGQTGKLLAYNLDGRVAWVHDVEGPVQSSPVVAEGKVYFATNDLEGEVYCLNALDGKAVWRYKPSPTNYILSSPVIADGNLFIASDNGHIYAFHDVSGSPAPGYEGWLVVLALLCAITIVVVITLLRRRRK